MRCWDDREKLGKYCSHESMITRAGQHCKPIEEINEVG